MVCQVESLGEANVRSRCAVEHSFPGNPHSLAGTTK